MKFKIKVPTGNKDTLTRTIRFDGYSYDMIELLANKYNVSFNYIVNEMIKYALKNMEE